MNEVFPFIIKNIKRRKLRSWLTIIGVIVGVLSIVALMSLSNGLKASVSSEFDKLGAQKITITSKYSQFISETNIGLSTDDVKTIEKIADIDYVAGSISGTVFAEYNNNKKFMSFIGYDIEYLDKMFFQENISLLKGKLITSKKSNEIIIGYDYYNDYEKLFNKRLDVGDKVKIDNSYYKVVGVLKDTGNPSLNQNNYISIDVLRDLTDTDEKIVDVIYAVIKTGKDVEVVGQKIEEKLERAKGESDFVVTTPKQAAEDQQDILNIISIVVIGIASISLLVGGIGIVNSMYTSVLERRKEIGVMKAIGAKKKDILLIFVLEAGMIGLLGGIIGTIGGFLLAYSVTIIGTPIGATFAIDFSFSIIALALGVSFVLGIVAGFLPAYQASNEEAIDALKEE
ncbi:MAG: ABC transporter permease [archaeon]|jgi:putative ABC transport system permease protein|nr:ABC transporter permease [archaeon]MDD2477864.1 ABC transporter permease [Candidatus ainarchaeum sp.]MDD3084599.1 ABC transporter permease [Candidatus ainarchaeum sp.]MDD4221112.1 ABC transporter permease [Candidatus ainarchaeum sp.]MDD4662599.1 ABC transporter permease [Candidatus ainarchaeum sp.]